MSESIPRRRWFRWSLRTLFVVVTVVACWLGYQVNWIRERHRYLDDQNEIIALHPLLRGHILDEPGDAPGVLRLFGERGHKALTIVVAYQPGGDVGAEINNARRLFPEAAHVGAIGVRAQNPSP